MTSPTFKCLKLSGANHPLYTLAGAPSYGRLLIAASRWAASVWKATNRLGWKGGGSKRKEKYPHRLIDSLIFEYERSFDRPSSGFRVGNKRFLESRFAYCDAVRYLEPGPQDPLKGEVTMNKLIFVLTGALLFWNVSSVSADSCQIITDKTVVESALNILETHYPHTRRIELMQGSLKNFFIETSKFTIENPRLVGGGEYFLVADVIYPGEKRAPTFIDLGFTFYRDLDTGRYLNLAKAAGCKTFGEVYNSLDEIPNP